jgi:Predicted permease
MIKNIFNKNVIDKITAVLLVVLLIFIFRSMINTLLFTFVFSFLLYMIQNFIFVNIRKIIKVERKLIIMLVYLVLVFLLVLVIYKYIPRMVGQLIFIAKQVGNFDITDYKGIIDPKIINLIQSIDVKSYVQTGSKTAIDTLSSIGKASLEVFFAFMLSLFFILEKDEISKFGKNVENSKISAQYLSIKYYVRSFVNSFSLVMKSQMLIALINSMLSMVTLAILGFHEVIGLAFMIFVLGLIPVAGMWISLIPLCIIAFKIGGIIKVAEVTIMILVLHAIEAYILNPKLMSMNTKLPVFFTFLVLIASENLMGIWGLLFGIPLFMFILNVLDIQQK